MKKVKEVKLELKKEEDEANKLLRQSMDSKNENDKNMYIRLYSIVQERIITLKWVLN
ncbi:MAG TPA: hypothetical protein VN026_17910 [Bacteroidia bacterium]|nr:hypothetical protein [Bacteroidia bacterium]